MKSTGAHSSSELQRFDLKTGQQDSSPSNGHQGDMPYRLMAQRKTAVNPVH